MNPCPCGYYGDPVRECTCSMQTISRYQKRISGPLLDRIDIHVEVPRVDYDKLASDRLGEPSEAVRDRVEAELGIENPRELAAAIRASESSTERGPLGETLAWRWIQVDGEDVSFFTADTDGDGYCDEINPESSRYLNRLSDLLFVLARVIARHEQGSEVLLQKGLNRD